jgi:hypothetical protein
VSDWCYCTGGESWTECDTATTREEAIAEATDHARARWSDASSVKIGRKHNYEHADFAHGLGEEIRERIRDRACDEAGEFAEEYPDMKSEPFDTALEEFVLDWLQKHAAEPLFFTVDDEEEVEIA